MSIRRKQKTAVLLFAFALITAVIFIYFFRVKKLSDITQITVRPPLQELMIEVRQGDTQDLYSMNDESIILLLNEIFDNTQVRSAPLRYKIKPYSNDPTWIGWDIQFEDELGHHSIYIRSMDSDYFLISINSTDMRAYRIQGDMNGFRSQIEKIIQKGIE